MKDLASNVAVRRAISPVSISDNTPVVSQIIAMAGFRSLVFAIALGNLADADATFVVLVEHSDNADLSGGEAVPDEQLIGTELTAGFQYNSDNETRKIGYMGSKAYVRLTITPANNTGASLLSAVAVLGHPYLSPVVV